MIFIIYLPIACGERVSHLTVFYCPCEKMPAHGFRQFDLRSVLLKTH